MSASRLLVVIAFAIVLVAPLVVRQVAPASGSLATPPPAGNRQTLIIVTPHIEQIREEFGAAFAAWNAKHFPSEPPVYIDWRVPGGTTEILRLLQAVYQAQLKRALAEYTSDPARAENPRLDLSQLFPTASIDFDLMFGGGSYDHSRLKDARNVAVWFKPFPKASVETCTLLMPKEGIDRTKISTLTELTTDVVLASRPSKSRLRLRVPIGAIQTDAGSAATVDQRLAPLLSGATEMTCGVDLSRVEREASAPVSIQAGFTPEQLTAWFGDNQIGAGQLYQDDRAKSGRDDDWQYWIGAALSGFGIVYNRELIAEAGLSEPVYFEDLCDFRYFRRVALADPRQSGSVATLYDSILNEAANGAIVKAREEIKSRSLDAVKPEDKKQIDELLATATQAGWDHGWRVIRELCANAHGFAASSTYPPMAVSQGEALAGVCIDFYGRGQAQAVLSRTEDPGAGRVGYIDPPGRVFIDADPVSLLRGGPNPALAKRFVEFCLSREGQALWQYPATTTHAGESNPLMPDAKSNTTSERYGPRINALRRMPARRDMYEPERFAHFIDKADPFKAASRAPSQGWRDGMIVMMGCMGIDVSDNLRDAWTALSRARLDPSFPKSTLEEMEQLFYEMPPHVVAMKDGSFKTLVFSAATYKEISADTNRWRDPFKSPEAKIAYTTFFRSNYRKIVELASGGSRQ